MGEQIIQAYLDDSGMGQHPASVLGGFVSSSQKWTEFSSDWQQALDMRPSISYFKMSEANALRGEFEHWSESRRNERVALLFSIIEQYALFGVSSAVHHEMYVSIFRGHLDAPTRFIEYPYFILFHGVVTSIAQYFAKIGQLAPIEFIFDSQPDQMKKMLEGWKLFVSVSPKNLQPLLARPPIFRNDKITMPLQAADLHAWWVHRMCDAYLQGTPELKPPFPGNKEKLNLPVLEMFWREDALRRMRASLTGSIPARLRPQSSALSTKTRNE